MFFISFSALIVSIGYTNAKETQVLPAGLLDPIREASLKCIYESSFALELLSDKHTPGHFTEEDDFRKILFCTHVKSGLGYENGHIKLEETAKYLPPNIQDIAVECDKIEGKDPFDTAVSFVKCFEGKSPIVYTIVPTNQ